MFTKASPPAVRIVILGAGFGGLQVAHELDPLAEAGELEVTLVDRAPAFQMGFALQWALDGRRAPEAGRRSYPPGGVKHARFVAGEARSIDTTGKVVETDGGPLPYDHLVIALGAELTMSHVPGLSEFAYNLYSMDSVLRLREAAAAIPSGIVVVSISGTPYKCPPAPFEYALLLEELLRKRGVRGACKVIVTSPEPQPMTVAGKAVGEAVVEMLAAQGIEFRPRRRMVGVDGGNSEVLFENGEALPFALLAATPKHQAPRILCDAGLAAEGGFVPVEWGTFRAKAEGVYAIGDVAGIELPGGKHHPKAGVFAERQGAAVGSAIAAEVRGGLAPPYDGRGICFFDVGGEQAAPASVDLLAPGGPRFTLGAPSVEGLEAKRAFERERLGRWFGKA